MRRAHVYSAAVLFLPAAALAALLLWLHQPLAVPKFATVRQGFTSSDAFLLDRHGELLDSERLNFGAERLDWTALADISPALVTAVVDGEDARFWRHAGVDWRSTAGALRDDLLHRRMRGASTITMQLAKLLQHSPPRRGWRAWAGKLLQARYALSLERHWTKAQILEAYLNLLDYRGELQGISAAATRLAGKTPAGLALPDSLVLAALLPQPAADADQLAARACARARARQLAIDCAMLSEAARTLLGRNARPDADHLAPQLAQRLLRRPGERVATTLDAGVQRRARDIVRDHLAALASQNVRDGAALVIDNATGEVLAYVGSAGPNSRSPQVDGVQALRQAGSTLKPFLYELAIERQYLTAASLLQDSPLNLDTATGTYIPQDYDHDFKGLVSVRTALAGSLNVPAVRALVVVGVEPFRRRLHDLGYAAIVEDGDFYGYSLALGSAEVSLWQQAQAYRSLARGGLWSSLTLSPRGEERQERKLPAGASFIVTDILSDRAARAITFGLDSHLGTPFWSAAKTGTSKDMRDNWCIGFSRQYTVAVWVGNFEGDAMRDVSGVTGAAPIWHDILVELQRDLVSAAPLASAAPSTPAGVHPLTVHFAPAVEPARSEWFLGSAKSTVESDSASITVASQQAQVPRIASPANGLIVALDPDIPPDRQRLPIEVHGDLRGKTLRLNDALLGAATPLQLWAPKAGSYYLTLQGEDGQPIDRVFFSVRAASM
jgi:penicillin-binding protein 1C